MFCVHIFLFFKTFIVDLPTLIGKNIFFKKKNKCFYGNTVIESL